MFPSASRERGEETETATVPVAFGKVMVLEEVVGSVMANTVFTASAVAPSNENGEAPVMLAPDTASPPETVSPPVKLEAVDVVAPRAVTVASVSVNERTPVFAMVMVPAPGVTEMPDPAESEATTGAKPVEPMRS